MEVESFLQALNNMISKKFPSEVGGGILATYCANFLCEGAVRVRECTGCLCFSKVVNFPYEHATSAQCLGKNPAGEWRQQSKHRKIVEAHTFFN